MTISFSPTSVAFGQKMVGDSEITPVTITNTDYAPASVTISGAGFSLVNASGAALSPSPSVPAKDPLSGTNGTLTVYVKFTPTAVQGYTGTLAASSSLSAGSATLTGTGVTATLDTPINEQVEGGVATRFQIAVPSPAVTLTMGRGMLGSTYDGFGVTAPSDNVFFNAGGMFWAQSKSELVLQSLDSDVFSLAKNNNTTVGVSTASLVGGGGVFIASGISADPITADAANPPSVSGWSSLGKSSAAAAISFGIFDLLLAAVVAVRGSYLLKDGQWDPTNAANARNKVVNTWLSVLSVASAAACATVGIAGAVATSNAFRSKDKQVTVNLPGVTIFGQAGMLIGTPAFCSVYGGAGLVLGSLFPFMCGIDVEIFGVKSATLTGIRDATVTASKKATLKSAQKVDILAAEQIKMSVDTQIAGQTYTTTMHKTDGVKIVGPNQERIWFDDRSVEFLHPVEFKVNVNNNYTIEVSDQVGIKMYKGGTANKIWMDDTDMALAHTGDIVIKAKAGQASVNLNAAGAVIAGNRIQLG